MPYTNPEVIDALVRAVPELKSTVDEHIEYFDELLPHLAIADIERWAEANVARAPEQVQRLMDVLDELFVDYAASELISVSFLEHLPRDSEIGDQLRGMVGPVCRAHMERYGI